MSSTVNFIRYKSGWEQMKLALNVSKTKFIVFHTLNKSVNCPNLLINGKIIERVTQFNFFWFDSRVKHVLK